MSYVILINDDNTAIATERQRLFQRSKLVDTLSFVVPKLYVNDSNSYNMEEFDFVMEYMLPSKTYDYKILVLTDNNYKEEYLKYTLPIDTNLSKEAGDVELKLSFIYTGVDADGNNIQRVRQIEPTYISIRPVSDWMAINPDPALDSLAQMIVANRNNIKAIEELQNTMYENQVTDINLDIENDRLQLVGTSGQPVGKGVDITDLGNEIAEEADEGLVTIYI